MTIRVELASLAVAGLLALGIAAPQAASAHHSFAMFDGKKTLTIKGTVDTFKFTNPHTYLRLDVASGGKSSSFLFEGPSPLILGQLGWNRNTIKAGDSVLIKYHPLRDGTPGGNMLNVTLPSGKALSAANEDVVY